MNDTNGSTDGSSAVLERLTEEWDALTPEAQKAARYVLENPQDVGISTVREIAEAAQVKPNTVVRMARQAGFEGYDDFRAPFREALRHGSVSFPDRARWLQDIRKSGDIGALYAQMIDASLRNLEETFTRIPATDIEAAARSIWNARQVFTLGVGVNNANARNFTYLASTGMVQFHAIPRAGSAPSDDLAWADERDVLIAMTMKPYRSEVVDAVRIAREQGLTVIALSDSPASPIALKADHLFTLSVETPQFFPSSVATVAVLETLLSFVIAEASDEIVDRVATFHRRRHQLGIYEKDGA